MKIKISVLHTVLKKIRFFFGLASFFLINLFISVVTVIEVKRYLEVQLGSMDLFLLHFIGRRQTASFQCCSHPLLANQFKGFVQRDDATFAKVHLGPLIFNRLYIHFEESEFASRPRMHDFGMRHKADLACDRAADSSLLPSLSKGGSFGVFIIFLTTFGLFWCQTSWFNFSRFGDVAREGRVQTKIHSSDFAREEIRTTRPSFVMGTVPATWKQEGQQRCHLQKVKWTNILVGCH